MSLESLRIIALVAGLVVMFGGGWAALLHLRIRQLEKLKDDLTALKDAFSEHKLADAMTYASKADLKESLLKIEAHLEKIDANFDKRMDGMSLKLSDLGKEVNDLARRVTST